MGFTTQEVCSDVSLFLVYLWLYNCVVSMTRQHVGRGGSWVEGGVEGSELHSNLGTFSEFGRERGRERDKERSHSGRTDYFVREKAVL
jgi:hypothetical protein